MMSAAASLCLLDDDHGRSAPGPPAGSCRERQHTRTVVQPGAVRDLNGLRHLRRPPGFGTPPPLSGRRRPCDRGDPWPHAAGDRAEHPHPPARRRGPDSSIGTICSGSPGACVVGGQHRQVRAGRLRIQRVSSSASPAASSSSRRNTSGASTAAPRHNPENRIRPGPAPAGAWDGWNCCCRRVRRRLTGLIRTVSPSRIEPVEGIDARDLDSSAPPPAASDNSPIPLTVTA